MEERAAKKLLRQLRFPGGKETHVRGFSWQAGVSSVEWRRFGGHAGAKVVDRVLESARALGFECEVEPASSISPDGNVVVSQRVYVDPGTGARLTACKRYGVTAAYNEFRLEVVFPG